MTLATYLVDKMRVTRPGPKTAEKNPERVYTVSGTFYSTEQDDDGNLIRKDKLTVPSKNVDKSDILSEGFLLDIANGILTVPAGERGRKAAESLDADTIAAELEALRNPTPEPNGKGK